MVLITKAPEVFAVSHMSSPATHNLGSAAQIPLGEGGRFGIGGVGIAVFRSRQGQVYAAQAECPHRAGPLADGLLGGEALICPLHNFRFNLATGEPLGNDCPALRIYPISVNEDGEILVAVSGSRPTCSDRSEMKE